MPPDTNPCMTSGSLHEVLGPARESRKEWTDLEARAAHCNAVRARVHEFRHKRLPGVKRLFIVPDMRATTMKTSIRAIALAMLALSGCEDPEARRQPVPVVLQAEKGEPVTLQIPRGFVEEPKDPEGALPNVLLRIAAKDFPGSEVLVPESEVRVLIEPNSSAADAGRARHATALRKHKSSEEAMVKSADLSKPGLIAYSYPNGREDAEAYYLASKSGDVFVNCLRSVCKAYKTWKKRVHVRFDYQPARTSDVQSVDASIDRLLQSFEPATKAAQ
jgi:hypothetical protein